MNEAREGDVREVTEGAEAPGPGAVTYTIKVLSAEREGGVRTVLFRRVSAGETIEFSAETDAVNLLAELPGFVDAALKMQRALRPAPVSRLPPGFFPRFAEESRLIRRLTQRSEQRSNAKTPGRRDAKRQE